jgi:hypothetical protein
MDFETPVAAALSFFSFSWAASAKKTINKVCKLAFQSLTQIQLVLF